MAVEFFCSYLSSPPLQREKHTAQIKLVTLLDLRLPHKFLACALVQDQDIKKTWVYALPNARKQKAFSAAHGLV